MRHTSPEEKRLMQERAKEEGVKLEALEDLERLKDYSIDFWKNWMQKYKKEMEADFDAYGKYAYGYGVARMMDGLEALCGADTVLLSKCIRAAVSDLTKYYKLDKEEE